LENVLKQLVAERFFWQPAQIPSPKPKD